MRLASGYAAFEYIITDDGSTDGTRDYLEKLSKNDARVKVIFLEKNGGIGNARNTAIREADGEYLLFIDQDDFFVDGAFDMLAARLGAEADCGTNFADPAEDVYGAANCTDVLCFGMNRVREDGSLIQAFPPELSGSALRCYHVYIRINRKMRKRNRKTGQTNAGSSICIDYKRGQKECI